jgi:hypothetical protein
LIIPAASDKPDKRGKPDYNRFLNFHKGIDGMIDGVIPANIMNWYYEAPKEDPMSASKFRAALDTGENLESFLPKGVDPDAVLSVLGVGGVSESIDEIINNLVLELLLERKKKKVYMEPHMHQDRSEVSDTSDGESEELEEVSAMSGGAVQGYAVKKDKDKKSSLIREKDTVVERVLNYLLQQEGL